MQDSKIEYKDYFAGKKILKQGFGFLGRGANVVKFLLENGADIIVTDTKTEQDLEKSINYIETFIREKYFDNDETLSREYIFANFKNQKGEQRISFKLGGHDIKDFINCDYIVAASGVAKDNIYLLAARQANKSIYQESGLFLEIVNKFNNSLKDIKDKIKIIGITGTRGKTTTTFLIKQIIENYLNLYNQKSSTNRGVYFGGNVKDIATLEQLANINCGSVVVMELDSWLLQNFKDLNFSPDIAVFTSFMPDHMNYYKGDMREYFADKANIFLYQNKEDVFVTTDKVAQNIREYFPDFVLDEAYILSSSDFVYYGNKYKTSLLGEHNKVNMSLAVKACEEFIKLEGNCSDSELQQIVQQTLDQFVGVPGRLEFVREIEGVKYYNDTTATTPEALMVALASLAPQSQINPTQINLICGGRDKELGLDAVAEMIIDYKSRNLIKNIVLLSDNTTTGTDRIIKIFEDQGFNNFILVNNIIEAVRFAKNNSAKGEIVLFSPGFASFGMFLNEYDRGDKYLQALSIVSS